MKQQGITTHFTPLQLAKLETLRTKFNLSISGMIRKIVIERLQQEFPEAIIDKGDSPK